MRWFKHMADASEGNSLTQIFEDFRHEGLAVYWLLVELLASKYTVEHAKENGEKFEFHEKILRKKLRISSSKLQLYLVNFQHLCLLNYNKSEKLYYIEMPKLRSIRDEHTTKSVKTPESLPRHSLLDIEVEKDIEGEEDIQSKPKNLKDSLFVIHEREFKLLTHYNKSGVLKQGHKFSDTNFNKIRKGLVKRKYSSDEEICQAIDNYKLALDSGIFSYIWDFWDFLSRDNADKFYPENFKPENYQKKNMGKSQMASQANMRLALDLGLINEEEPPWTT